MIGNEGVVIGIKGRDREYTSLVDSQETRRLVKRPVHLLLMEGILGNKRVLDIQGGRALKRMQRGS